MPCLPAIHNVTAWVPSFLRAFASRATCAARIFLHDHRWLLAAHGRCAASPLWDLDALLLVHSFRCHGAYVAPRQTRVAQRRHFRRYLRTDIFHDLEPLSVRGLMNLVLAGTAG
jgi:hypothetical protein